MKIEAERNGKGAVERQSVESTVTDGGRKANATAPQPILRFISDFHSYCAWCARESISL